jgi:phosphoglycolate phosphatase-like HAD superfamily hydrolase
MLSGAPQPRRDVIVIGDTPRDVHCAKANGCVAFGVATGPYALAELREAGADVVVVDLTEATVIDVVLGDR